MDWFDTVAADVGRRPGVVGPPAKCRRPLPKKPATPERTAFSVTPTILKQCCRRIDDHTPPKAIYAERGWDGKWRVAEPDRRPIKLAGSIAFICESLANLAAHLGGADELRRLTLDGKFEPYAPSGAKGPSPREASEVLAEFCRGGHPTPMA